ncbi:MAG: osmotically inducible protein OsmC [Bdellovibrionales bacterium GWB1_55_8]|nr:MAG: osmotically inducible protein OsmC [Bdellovibrionales bacterium GWB1_55_8]
MEMKITFPGNRKVYAEYGEHTIATDQPVQGGGDGSAPAPFDLFLASIGTCAGIYVLAFAQKRGLPTEGLEIIQRMVPNPETRLMGKISLEIKIPRDFPEQYRESLINAANLCLVKKTIAQPPEFEITTTRNS